MQFTTGQTVVRHDPGGRDTTWDVDSAVKVACHTDLQAKGYKYTDITKGAVVADTMIDFDLPEQAPFKTKPRVHDASEAVCVSCEG